MTMITIFNLLLLLPTTASFGVYNNNNNNDNNNKPSGTSDKRDNQIECLTQEEYPANTFVENIAKQLNLNQRLPPHALNLLRFKFLTQPSCPEGQCFVMDERTGDLRTAFQIDRDAICPRAENCEIAFDIAIQPMEYFIIVKVKVEIIDINDNVPSFPQPVVHHQIHEFADVGTGIVIPAATDPDSPKYGIQRYALLQADVSELKYSPDSLHLYFNSSFLGRKSRGRRSYEPYFYYQQEARSYPSQKFELKHKTTADGGTDLRLVLQEKLDREIEDHYLLTVLAIDGGSPPTTGSVLINITVQDANDNSPIFENAPYEVTVPENFPVNSLILRVKAKDKDIGLNAAIVYEFSESTRLDYGHLFSIKPDSGKIFLKNNLDYEGTTKVYQLYVIATDKGPDSIPARASVAIRVEDVNDHSPQIQVKTLTSKTFAEVQENSNIGTFVAHLSVTDSDSGDNGRFLCQVDDQNFKLSQVYDMELTVVTAKVLDRESRGVYDLSISCRDFGQQPHTSSVPLKVMVTDENDNDPLFEKPLYEAALRENSPVGTVILKVTATDPDADENGRISYSLTEGPNLVAIEENSGILRSVASFDFEQINELEFQLTASDHGQTRRSSNARLKLVILDEDDSRPVFEQESYEFKISENMPAGTLVGEVRAYDEESKTNKWEANFVYHLESTHEPGSNPFYHHPLQPNLGRDPNYDVVLDQESSSSAFLSRFRRTNVIHRNPPKRDDKSGHPERKKSVDPRKFIRSSEVERFQSRNVPHKQLETFQTTANVQDLFEVDSVSGRISTRQVLDREYRESYKFFVTSYVAASPAPVSYSKNNAAKQRSNSDQNRKRNHFKSNEFLDMRTPVEHQGTLFEPAINPPVTFDAPRASHTATVLVTVTIDDINDNRPYFLFPATGNETLVISSHTPPGHSIGRVRAVDPDLGLNAELTYHILSFSATDHVTSKMANKRRQNFRLSPTTGELSVVGDLSEILVETYSFELVAKDSGKPQLTGHSRLKVTISSDVPYSGYSRFSYDSAYGILASEDTVVVLAFTLALVLLAIIIIIGVMCALKKRTEDGRNGGGGGNVLSGSPNGEMRRRLFQNSTKTSVPGCGTECLIDSYSSSVVGVKPLALHESGAKEETGFAVKSSACCCFSDLTVGKAGNGSTDDDGKMKEKKKKKKLRYSVECDAENQVQNGGVVSNGCHPLNNLQNKTGQSSVEHSADVGLSNNQLGKATAIVSAYVTPEATRKLHEEGTRFHDDQLEEEDDDDDDDHEENCKNEKLERGDPEIHHVNLAINNQPQQQQHHHHHHRINNNSQQQQQQLESSNKTLAVAQRKNTSPLYFVRPQSQLSLMPSVDKNKPEVEDSKYRSAKLVQLGSQFNQSTAQPQLNLMLRNQIQKQLWSTLDDDENVMMMMIMDHPKMIKYPGAYASGIIDKIPEESPNGPSSINNLKLQNNNIQSNNTILYSTDGAAPDGTRSIPRPFVQTGFTTSRLADVGGLKPPHYQQHHLQPQNHYNPQHHNHQLSLQPRNGLLVEMPLSITKSQSVTNLPSRTTPIQHHHHLEGMFTIHRGEEGPFTMGEMDSTDDFG